MGGCFYGRNTSWDCWHTCRRGLDKAQLTRVLIKGLKLHLSQLPPLPTMHTNLEAHPLGDQFKRAKQEHLASHQQMKSWKEVPLKAVKSAGHQILDCMWVYTYIVQT
jgi:hypothetical protein